MSKIIVPKLLVPIDLNNFNKFKTKKQGKALFVFKEDFSDANLDIYRTPFEFSSNDHGFGVYGFNDRMKNLGWYIRQSRKRDGSFWDSFSEDLVMNKVIDRKKSIYEIKCNQTFATTSISGGISENSYFLSSTKRGESLRDVFYFSANKLVGMLDSEGFSRKQVEKLADFLYRDFTTQKYAQKSREIGQCADACFF